MVLMFLSAIGFLLGLALHLALLLGFTDSPVDWMFVHGGLLLVWPLLIGIMMYRGWKGRDDYIPQLAKATKVFLLCLFVYSGSYLVSNGVLVYVAISEGRSHAPEIADTLGLLGLTAGPLLFHAAAFIFFYAILYAEEPKE